MPIRKSLLNYETTLGSIKHFYGYQNTLGGIVSIKGADFERIGGFPNFWAWGYEDNLLQLRAQSNGLMIDRSVFFPMLDVNIIHLNEGINRTINKGEFDKYVGNTNDGLQTLKNITKSIDEVTGFINITSFTSGSEPNVNQNIDYDLRNGNVPFKPAPVPNYTPIFKPSRRGRGRMGMF
jgi:hypothetical protein